MYDDSGVELPDDLYINASKIQGFNRDGEKKPMVYIATQGPLQGTVDDFYVMLVEKDVRFVVMLTKVVETATEAEIPKEKCHRYWPPFVDPKVVSPDGTTSPASSPVSEDTCPLLSEVDPDGPVVRDGNLVCKSVVVKPVEELIIGPVIKRIMDIYRVTDVCCYDLHIL